jgi:hypothetical protein
MEDGGIGSLYQIEYSVGIVQRKNQIVKHQQMLEEVTKVGELRMIARNRESPISVNDFDDHCRNRYKTNEILVIARTIVPIDFNQYRRMNTLVCCMVQSYQVTCDSSSSSGKLSRNRLTRSSKAIANVTIVGVGVVIDVDVVVVDEAAAAFLGGICCCCDV